MRFREEGKLFNRQEGCAANFSRRLGRCLLAAIIGALFFTALALAQTTEKCPFKAALTLSQVLARATDSTKDEELISLIRSCRISFPLSIATIDRLSEADVSLRVMEALDLESISPATVEQAQLEVAALEGHIKDILGGIAADPGSALGKLEREYRAQRAKAQQVDPRLELEKSPENEERLRQSRVALATLDREHDANLVQYTALFEFRIHDIKERPYAITSRGTYQSYDAATERLSIALNGDEYWFSKVAPETAKSFKENWGSVKIGRHYEDNGSRILFLSYSGPAVEGQSRTAIEAAQQRQAALDDAAKQRQAALVQEQLAAAAEQRRNGEWVDQQTGLMWTLTDNGAFVNWNAAADYCRALRTGGFSDWRLPSIDELSQIADQGASSGLKGGIAVTTTPSDRTNVWSGNIIGPTYDGAGNISEVRPTVWTFSYKPRTEKRTDWLREGKGTALCRRHYRDAANAGNPP